MPMPLLRVLRPLFDAIRQDDALRSTPCLSTYACPILRHADARHIAYIDITFATYFHTPDVADELFDTLIATPCLHTHYTRAPPR